MKPPNCLVLFLRIVICVCLCHPVASFLPFPFRAPPQRWRAALENSDKESHTSKVATENNKNNNNNQEDRLPVRKAMYNLGLGKNQPVGNVTIVTHEQREVVDTVGSTTLEASSASSSPPPTVTRRLVAKDEHDAEKLLPAVSDELHFTSNDHTMSETYKAATNWGPGSPVVNYPDIDLSIPESVYAQDGTVDLVWDLLRHEAYQESLREPLLVSFLHSTILNHPSLESSLAFLLANRLQSPAMMISTQLQSLILEALHQSPDFRRALRADIMAVRDRDPACHTLPDVFLYFKGFHALQSHRVAHYLWQNDKHLLASYLQSQVSQVFQIDIHPNATLGSGVSVDRKVCGVDFFTSPLTNPFVF